VLNFNCVALYSFDAPSPFQLDLAKTSHPENRGDFKSSFPDAFGLRFHNSQILGIQKLVGCFNLENSINSQIGSFPQVYSDKNKKIWNHHLEVNGQDV